MFISIKINYAVCAVLTFFGCVLAPCFFFSNYIICYRSNLSKITMLSIIAWRPPRFNTCKKIKKKIKIISYEMKHKKMQICARKIFISLWNVRIFNLLKLDSWTFWRRIYFWFLKIPHCRISVDAILKYLFIYNNLNATFFFI